MGSKERVRQVRRVAPAIAGLVGLSIAAAFYNPDANSGDAYVRAVGPTSTPTPQASPKANASVTVTKSVVPTSHKLLGTPNNVTISPTFATVPTRNVTIYVTPQPTEVPTAVPTAEPEDNVNVAEGPDRTYAMQVFEATNKARNENGLNSVAYNPALTSAAQGYATLLADRWAQGLELGHLFDGNPEERALRAGYEGVIYENYGGDQLSNSANGEQFVTNIWQPSPPHWENILNPKHSDLGVGCTIGYRKVSTGSKGLENYFEMCVEDFGYRRQTPPPVPTSATNPSLPGGP